MAKILVVEDSDAVRAKMRHFLEENGGHSVLEASDGANALDIIKENSDIDLIFCDVNMPVMDGITFASALKDEDGLKDIPLVMCTTENFESVRDDIKQLGIRAWMTKPISKKLLILALKKILND